MMYDDAYTQNGCISIPDREITKDLKGYIYVPLKGYSKTLAVFDEDDVCIGWILAETLGYSSANAWMKDTKWVDQGY